MEGKTVKETSTIMVEPMTPQDANVAGNVFGGAIMKLIDAVAGIVARRHARGNVVTALIDRLDFHHPVFIEDVLTLKASLNLVGRTSMEIGVRVEAENILTGEARHTASAYLTFVSLDEGGRPTLVPSLVLKLANEMRRNREAQARREVRIREKRSEK